MLKDNGFTKEQQDLAREITKDNKKHVHAGACPSSLRLPLSPASCLTVSAGQTSTPAMERRSGAT
jgi:hypothetical protein